MKKQIYFLVSLFALIGFSINVMGQDFTQNLGESHKFTVTDNPNSTFAWKVYSTLAGSTFTGEQTDGSYFTKANEGTHEVTYTWTGIPAATYYVVVTETNKTTNCATTRYTTVKINPNAYDLVVENKDNAGTSVVQSTCMAGAGRVFAKDASITKMSNDLYYFVTLKNDATEYVANWKFNYTLTVKDKVGSTLTPSSVTVIKTDGTPETGVAGVAVASTGTEATVTGLSKFIVKVSVDDNFSTSTGAPDNANIVVNFNVLSIAVGPGAVGEASGASGVNTFEYTRTTYPNTSAITVN